MPESSVRSEEGTVVAKVVRPMNDHRSMTVEVADQHSTRHIVEYDTDRVERTLAALPQGSALRVLMTPIEGRANVWRVGAPEPRRASGR
ncbi:hypothetical protein ACFO0N_15745 [Halobium salinum]|uniref:DUF7999 domain-containing protein n=1 Tax=Halobium salinum TaxID=1364940 RepID=A0ABD5PER7_9EURY|nr:hypothetical protein [Halobium salinum]